MSADNDGGRGVERPPTTHSRGKWRRLIAIPVALAGVSMFALGLFAGAGVAGAWNVHASALSGCNSDQAVIVGFFGNIERRPSGDMYVTMTWNGLSDGPRLVANQSTRSFTIRTSLQSLPAGQVTFDMTWADGRSGTDSTTASFEGRDCTPPPTSVTPSAPTTTTPICQNPDEVVTPSTQTGVIWTPSGSTTLKPGDSVTYHATPAQGYTFPSGAQTEWFFKNWFDPSDCTQLVTPTEPTTTTPTCQSPDEVVTPSTQTGVVEPVRWVSGGTRSRAERS